MQDIKLRMLDMPSRVKSILRIIKIGSPKDISLLAAIPLGIIDRKAQESLEAAKETERKFNFMKLLLDEVTAVTTTSQVWKFLKIFIHIYK